MRASRYPPAGERGIGGSRTRLYGGDDYVQHANEEILLIAEIEHRDGVANAAEILSVPGVDAYFIGPGDLCASLGLPHTWDPDFPEYWSALERVRSAARATGVPGGIHTGAARVRQMVQLGYQFLALGFDISFMAQGAASALEAARAAESADRQGAAAADH